jgi:hypothetical protein
MSPLPTLVVVIAKGNTFSISSPSDVTKLQTIVLTSHRLAALHSQCRRTRIFVVNCSVRTCAKHKNVQYTMCKSFLTFNTPMTMGSQLGPKRHRKSHYSSQCSRKLWFRHYYQWLPFISPRPIFTSAIPKITIWH